MKFKENKKKIARPFVIFLSLYLLLYLAVSLALFSSTFTINSFGTISAQGTYIIYQNNGITYVKNASSGFNVFSSASANLAFTAAFGYVQSGGNITVEKGIYTATGSSIMMRDCQNVNVNFRPNSVLTIANWVDASVIQVWNSTNITFTGMTIDGNAANQEVTQTTDGILIYDSSNVLVTKANITNCRNYGWAAGANSACVTAPSGITYSTITNCYWNGICLACNPWTPGNYAIGNDVSNCSDVGISSWYSYGIRIIGNHIHDINGTYGWAGEGTGSHYGIALEADSFFCEIINNTIENCPYQGINYDSGGNSLIKNNTLDNCKMGLVLSDNGYDVVTQNHVSNWGQQGESAGAILIFNGTNDIISFNTLIDDDAGGSTAIIYVTNLVNSAICNNTASIPLVPYSYGVDLGEGCGDVMIEGNNIQAIVGIEISSDVYSTRLCQNTLSNCTTPVSDSGTGTIYVPPSANSILVLDSPSMYGSVNPICGKYVTSNSSQVVITLTPLPSYESALNVDGIDVILTNNTCQLSMGKDHIVYAFFSNLNKK